MKKSSKWEPLIKDYENYLSLEKGLAKNSIENYIRDIKKVGSYFSEQYPDLSPLNMNTEELSQFLYDAVKKGYSERTQARFISTIKSFCKFLVAENYRTEHPAELLEPPRISKKFRDTLQIEEIQSMIKNIPVHTVEGKRDRVIVEILYGCGLRVSELINLNISDVHLEEDFISVMGKGTKRRFVPINPRCKKLLEQYIKEIREELIPKKGNEHYLFLNKRGQKLSRVLIFTFIKKLGNHSGIRKNISPHTFRHSFATHLLNNGADVLFVQKMLGHESPSTTEIYAHTSLGHLRETLFKFHPLENNEQLN